jgi:predicted O-linked N-acetylglucosamine transferase (SPINDLY family)
VFANLLRRLGWRRIDTENGGATAASDDLSAIPDLVQAGHAAEAETRLRAALRANPDSVDALHYLGLVCHQSGRHADALAHLSAAVQRAPGLAFLRANHAEVLRAAGQLEAAEGEARAALALDPTQAAAEFNLAAILAERGRHAEALEHGLRALAGRPDWVEALTLGANVCIALEQRAKAQELLARARNLQPEHPGLVLLSLRNRAWLCDWAAGGNSGGDSHGDHSAFEAVLQRRAAQPGAADLRALNPFVAYEYPVAQRLRDAVTQSYADGVIASAGRHEPSPAVVRGDKERLRIGYVSADFHSHPTMHLMRSFFGLHDRARFEVHAYSIGADDGSAYRRRVMDDVEHFTDIRAETPRQSAARIARDGIHILVDLKGYTHEARPETFALRPAPLRVAWLGYPASTGRGINDYAIVDAVVAPPGQQPHWGEQLVWMPHSYQVNDCEQPIAAHTPERAELGLPAEGFVFACFNHVYKIEPRMFAAWMRILARVPGSVLWLYCPDRAAQANLEQAASAAGVDPRRLVFAGTAAKPDHLARLRRADLFLDTLWINAHTGASDALWAGLPVLTCPQDAFPSRVAASLVSAAGLPQLICADLRDYEEKAVRLASQDGELRAMREHLETQHARLPLFDTARFTRNLERAYDMMWRRHAAGEAPQAFAVTEEEDPEPASK